MTTNTQLQDQYLNAHQTRSGEPSEYENLVADAIERAFGAGITELTGIADALRTGGVPAPNGMVWTAELLASELKRLGD